MATETTQTTPADQGSAAARDEDLQRRMLEEILDLSEDSPDHIRPSMIELAFDLDQRLHHMEADEYRRLHALRIALG